MKCTAKIQDSFGNKYKCSRDTTKKIIIKEFIPHLNKERIRHRFMCNKHAKRFVTNMRYQIRHCGKIAQIEVIELIKTV